MGTFAKDTYETASRAALVGGTTTLIEMICPAREEKPLEGFRALAGTGRREVSACDFTFHMGVTRYDERSGARLREIVRRGISSFQDLPRLQGRVRQSTTSDSTTRSHSRRS